MQRRHHFCEFLSKMWKRGFVTRVFQQKISGLGSECELLIRVWVQNPGTFCFSPVITCAPWWIMKWTNKQKRKSKKKKRNKKKTKTKTKKKKNGKNVNKKWEKLEQNWRKTWDQRGFRSQNPLRLQWVTWAFGHKFAEHQQTAKRSSLFNGITSSVTKRLQSW